MKRNAIIRKSETLLAKLLRNELLRNHSIAIYMVHMNIKIAQIGMFNIWFVSNIHASWGISIRGRATESFYYFEMAYLFMLNVSHVVQNLIWLISDLLIHITCKLWSLVWLVVNVLDTNLCKCSMWSRDVVKIWELRLISTEIARHIIGDIIHSVADYHLICFVNVFKYSAISISRGHFFPRYWEWTEHSWPVRARYGVSFADAKFELCFP